VALIACTGSLRELPHGQPPGFNPQAPRQSQPPPSRSLHDLHHPLYLQDPRIRPLAGSGTAVAGCAPPYCAIADGPELEKAWLFGRSSWPLSAPASPHASHHPLLSLAITQLASPNTLSRRQAKERFVGTQRHGLPFQVPAEPRIYLAESEFGPKHAPRLRRTGHRLSRTGRWPRLLITAPSPTLASRTRTTRPTPTRRNTLQNVFPTAALGTRHRGSCISKDVRSTASIFLPAY
jgi:hypothetical protein